jgi:hypothetical protein
VVYRPWHCLDVKLLKPSIRRQLRVGFARPTSCRRRSVYLQQRKDAAACAKIDRLSPDSFRAGLIAATEGVGQ